MEALYIGLASEHVETVEESFNASLEVIKGLNKMHLERIEVEPSLTYTYPIDMYQQVVETILNIRNANLTTGKSASHKTGPGDYLLIQAMNRFEDLRSYGYRILGKIAGTAESANTIFRILRIMVKVVPSQSKSTTGRSISNTCLVSIPSGYKEAITSLKATKHEFTQTWLKIVDQILHLNNNNRNDSNTAEGTKSISLIPKILRVLDKRVIPFLTKPVLMADFLTAAYNIGGAVSILALESLFTLIQKHNLDYPSFYTKLYALMEPNVYHHPEFRTKFLSLCSLFMTSNLLPTYLVAAFVKRACRLALFGPPIAGLWALAFTYNMMKAHPAVRVLIHQELLKLDTDTTPKPAYNSEKPHDQLVYNPIALDPADSNAIKSSLWELQTFTKHYWGPNIRLADMFSDRLTKKPFDLEQLLNSSQAELPEYGNLAYAELTHSWSKMPPIKHDIDDVAF